MNRRAVKGFEGFYEVTSDGLVISLRRHALMKPKIDRYGYAVVRLTKGECIRHVAIHRLVAEAYLPNPDRKPCVNHIDENKLNNSVENLEWVTVKENDNHGTRNKCMAKTKCKAPVERLPSDGKTQRFDGVKDASRCTGINRCQIAKCCQGKAKTAGGYEWRYANG